MFRGLALSPSHTTLQLAVALVESVRRHAAFAGFPLSAWAFALRIWAAMMVALYAAFWLQLESASSAAVTVGILALQTRGQAYQKAVYRILCTVIGVIASFVIAGLFAQERELFVHRHSRLGSGSASTSAVFWMATGRTAPSWPAIPSPWSL